MQIKFYRIGRILHYFYRKLQKVNFTIFQAGVDNAKELADLAAETFYDTWKNFNTEEDLQVYLLDNFKVEIIEKEILRENIFTYFLAREGANTAGYAKLRRDTTHEIFGTDAVIEIEKFYIKNEYKGRGLASEIMDLCLNIARKEKRQWVWLGVALNNPRAIRFYKKFGFEEFGIKMFRMGETEDPDHLMKLELK